jgi:DnaA-homolog protein
MQQLLFDFSRPPPPTFANFAAGRNGELLTTLQAVLAGELSERSLCIWGARGSGKTHLLRAAVQTVQQTGRRAVYAAPIGVEMLDTLDRLPALVAIDDAERLDDLAQGALFRVFDRLREEAGTLVVATAAAPAQLALREDLRTRLASGLVFHVQLLDDDEKAQALYVHAATRGFALPPEVADYLLRHRQRDLPSLLRVLDAADHYSLQTKRPLTLPLLREVLQLAGSSESIAE